MHLKWGYRQPVPISDPRAGSLILGVLWVPLSFWEAHPGHPARRQHGRLGCCLAKGMWVTASSALGGPHGHPETGHDPQHMGCFQWKQNLAPLSTFCVSLWGSKILSSSIPEGYGFTMDLLLFIPLGGTREEVGCSLVMWNIYFFSLLPWWQSRWLVWLQKVHGTQHQDLSRGRGIEAASLF